MVVQAGKSSYRFLLKILISAVILAILFYKIPLNEILNALNRAEPGLIFLCVIFYLIIVYLISFQTKYLTKVQNISVSIFQLIKINLITKFYSLFLPGTISGNIVRWYKLSKYGDKTKSAAVVLFSRYLETFMLLYIGTIFFISFLIIKKEYLYILLLLAGLIILVLSYILLLNPKALNFCAGVIKKIPLPKSVYNFSEKFFEAMNKFQELTLSDHFKILLIVFTSHFISVLIYFMLSKSLNLNIGFIDIAWIRSASVLISMIPVSFAGLGLREGSFLILLGNYGISPTDSVALSFLIFFLLVFISLWGGVVELADFFSLKRENISDEIPSGKNLQIGISKTEEYKI